MKPSQEFVKGKHNIGYVESSFISHVGDEEFELKGVPTFQRLPRNMNDAEIERELKPGLCDLGDIIAFMDNPPEGTKDGYTNLFYTPAFVVGIYWRVFDDVWDVNTWRRSGDEWNGGRRVFSSATGSSATSASGSLEPSDTSTLPDILVINGVSYKRE